MKFFIISTLAIVCTLAEPPVDNRYLPPQQGGGALAPSQTYGTPSFGQQRQTSALFRGRQSPRIQSRRPSTQYGAPQRSPSALYNAPSAQFNAPSTQYGAPAGQFTAPSTQYGAPAGQFAGPSTQYGAPAGQFAAPSTQYGAPAGQFAAPSTQYGAPAGQFAAPSTQYGAPSGKFAAPSTQYGAPSGKFAAPSTQYGTPGANTPSASQYGSLGAEQSRQYLPPGTGRGGYDGEEGNGEPANYSFEYMVRDESSGNDFGHREARQGDRAEGLYYVVLPDGRKQTVEYEADQDGYKPRISYEDTGAGVNGYGRDNQYNGQGGPY